jgi:putative ABC transport system ATP-binding protein
MTNKVIELHNIQKAYATGRLVAHVLKGISLTINEGEFVAIMGPSGSGKSTLMNIMGFLDVPNAGEYKFDGLPTTGFDEDELAEIRRNKIGFVFQMFYLLSKMTSLDNVKLPMLYAGVQSALQDERAIASLAAVGLEDRMDHRPNELSGGQQQRVSIARALVNQPRVIFADEPTGNLDSKSGDEVMEIFQQLHNDGKTIIMVTHEDDIAAHASRKIIIKDGLILEDIQQKPLKTKKPSAKKK